MSFNAFRENKILAKISESTVYDLRIKIKTQTTKCIKNDTYINDLRFLCVFFCSNLDIMCYILK